MRVSAVERAALVAAGRFRLACTPEYRLMIPEQSGWSERQRMLRELAAAHDEIEALHAQA